MKNENPLIFYDKISDLAKIFLKSKGTLYFEINQYLGEQMKGLLKSKGFIGISLFPAHGLKNCTNSKFLFYNIVMSRGEFG